MGEGAGLDRLVRVLLVVPHDGLRADLSRALSAIGYEVVARPRLAAGAERAAARPSLRVIDVEACSETDGAAFAGADAPPTVWLAGGASLPPLDPARSLVLAKPFSLDALERGLLDLERRDAGPADRIDDPMLRSREPLFRARLEQARRWAARDVPVVIEGELGSGRRALARAMHRWSARHGEAFERLEPAEVEAAGAGAAREAIGRAVRRAEGGTLVPIEPVGWRPEAQRALAQALRAEAGRPRCLTLTREPLEGAAEAGRLEPELLYRLDVATVALPPLRDRPADHVELCEALARRVSRQLGRPTPTLDPERLATWAAEGFPGNRVGLESRLRSLILHEAVPRVGEARGAGTAGASAEASLDLKTLERDTIVRALAHHEGNRTHASASLGISVRTLRNKIREYGLR